MLPSDPSSENDLHRDAPADILASSPPAEEIWILPDELARLQESLKAAARRQAAAAELGRHALSGASPALLLDEATFLVARALDVEYCGVIELLPDGSALLLCAGVGWKDGCVGSATVEAGASTQAGYTLRCGEPVIVEDLRAETRFTGSRLLSDHDILSGVSVVISGPYRPYGVLGIHTSQPRTFTEDDINFLEVIANILGTAIERKQAEQTAHERTEALIRTLNTLVSRPELDPFLGQTLSAVVEHLRAASAALWFYEADEDALTLHLTCADGQIRLEADSERPATAQPLSLRRYPSWSEILRLRLPLLLDGSGQARDFPYRELIFTDDAQTALLVPLLLGEETLGWFVVRFREARRYHPADVEYAQALAQQAALAVHLTRLAAQGRQAAVLEERNRVAREVHDTLAQGFTGIIIQLNDAEEVLIEDPTAAAAHLAQARDLARESLAEARRSVRALRPLVLEGSDLAGALARLGARMTADTGVQTHFQVYGSARPLPAEAESNLLRIGLEALTNALHHAQATTVQIELTFAPEEIRLSVSDDGVGFDPGLIAGDRFGLVGMRERAISLGGHLTITSAPGRGTRVLAETPTQHALPFLGRRP